jgi:hypothetical protein
MPHRKITMLAVAVATAAFMAVGCSNNEKTASNSTFTQQNNNKTYARQYTAAQQKANFYVCFPQSKVFYEPESRTWYWLQDQTWFEGATMPQIASLRWERPSIVSCDDAPFFPGCTQNAQFASQKNFKNQTTMTRNSNSRYEGANTFTKQNAQQNQAQATANTNHGFAD